MSTITERTRPKNRSKILPPSIREVCLIGTRARRYVHISPAGLRNRNSGPSSKRAISRKT
jgi:hypothetical protein